MGAYLSEPITEKVSSDETGNGVKCGASSMQGWRVSQEDAHNCIIDYSGDASFFAVYDGHGGHEVAQYCAQHFPQFLKNCETYKNGDYVQALKAAFLGFDATLRSPEVIAILKRIVKGKEESRDNSGSEDEENVKNLYAEAEMPLEQVMAKYRRDLISSCIKKSKDNSGKNTDPELDNEKVPEASGSGTVGIKLNSETDTDINSSAAHEKVICEGSGEKSSNGDVEHTPSSSSNGDVTIEASLKSNEVADVNGLNSDKDKSSSKDTETAVTGELITEKEMNGIHAEDSDIKNKCSDLPVKNVSSAEAHVENGEINVNEDQEDTSNEEKGKRKIIPKSQERKLRKSLRQHAAVALYHSLLGGQDQSDSDSDEADESFKAYDSSEEEEDEERESGGGEEVEEDEEGGEEEEDEDDSLDADDEDEDFNSKMTEEPGSDSGCTAVVALLKGQELYVANAGDSRCVVCRKGQAVEMSLDHKPEDECEMERIMKAGGKVTADGRVNGGLNLSRALGDHAYKQTENLPPEEQMITALPDVRTLMIDPKEDEFMVLACDGIWNFMSSQDVVDFVRPRIMENSEKLSLICEELFDHCLAPSTVGDGTGCDNMTAVIVQFLSPDITDNSKSIKRALSPSVGEENAKRSKTEEELSSA